MPESIRKFSGLKSAFQRRNPISSYGSSLPPFELSYKYEDTVVLSKDDQEVAQLHYLRSYEHFRNLWAVQVMMDGDLYCLRRDGISHTEQFTGDYPQLTHFWLSGDPLYWLPRERNMDNKGKLSMLKVTVGKSDRQSRELAVTYNPRPGYYNHTVTLYDRTKDRRRPKVIEGEEELFKRLPENLYGQPDIAGRTKYEVGYDSLAARIIETAQLPELLAHLPILKSPRR